MNFAIGIPTINRNDLLQEALAKYAITFPNVEIFVIDNGNQQISSPHPKTQIYVPDFNYGVAKSWNYLCSRIFGANYSHALILNDDVILGSTQEQVKLFIEETETIDFAVALQSWSAFLLPKKTFLATGPFDEQFYPAYFEDNDYHYRMQQLGLTYIQTPLLHLEVFRNSQTIAKDKTLNDGFEKNKAYYMLKWGGLPHQETFSTPFNEMTKEQAIKAMMAGRKVSHKYFTSEEYIQMRGYMGKGGQPTMDASTYWLSGSYQVSEKMFWHDRSDEQWDTGWRLFETKEPSKPLFTGNMSQRQQAPRQKLSEFLLETVPDVKLEDAKKAIRAYREYMFCLRGNKDQTSNFCDVCYKLITEEEARHTTIYDFNYCCEEHREFKNALQLDLVRKQLGIEVEHLPMLDIYE